MSIHDGHRRRLKNRFREEGLEHFEDVNLLELLLFYCIPRQDTNPIAHALLEHFGSLPQVLEAPVEELCKISRITDNAAILLNLIPAVSREYQVRKGRDIKVLTTTDECGKYLLPYFTGLREECVYALCLDAKCKVLCCKEVGKGSVNSAGVSPRRVAEVALAANATSVVLAHNHPSGLALPSGEDVHTTRRMAAALEAVEIRLADHIVVADGDFVSLAQSGYYRPDERYTLV